MTVQLLRQKLERQKGQKLQVEKSLQILRKEFKETKLSLYKHEQAREIIHEVGLKTQQQLQYHISDITSLALEAVFTDPYELKVEFVERRNKTECDLKFARDGFILDNPKEESGVGAIDVAAFALRIASWSMNQPHTRNVLILDEPFKHLKGEEENHRVLEMINEISHRMNIQIIMVSDERIAKEDIIASADKVFEVYKRKGRSKIRILTN